MSLSLPPEDMRALGYRVVDLLVDRAADPSIPALERATPAEMSARLSEPPPSAPQDFGAVLARLERDVLPYMNRADHPRYFAFIPSCQTFPGALGDFIASALNVYVGSWMEAAGPSQVELTVTDWFKDWLGYPDDAAGLLVSGFARTASPTRAPAATARSRPRRSVRCRCSTSSRASRRSASPRSHVKSSPRPARR
ncbi:MAG TPA: hypothetical protein VFG79_13170 [Solirubrobacter sp.]|nr:hypothetical protein [Solirubrobacter sp.]